MSAATYESYSSMSRGHAIEQLGALACATTAEMLEVIVAADRDEDWRVDGALDMASWLVATLHVSSATAREWVRVGRALEGLPHLQSCFAAAELSWDQIAAATKFATPELDEMLAHQLLGLSAAQIEEMARQELTVDPGPDPTMVVVHVDAETLEDDDGGGNGSVNGVQVAADTVRRLLCDSSIEANVEGPDGTCIGIGRIDRHPPRWLRRRIAHRDQHHCRFPGCGRRIRQIHHVSWWNRDHGPTDSWNLVGLCWQHHHLVHEGRWTVSGNADGALTFTSPYGRTLTNRPPPLLPDTRARVQDISGFAFGDQADPAGPAP